MITLAERSDAMIQVAERQSPAPSAAKRCDVWATCVLTRSEVIRFRQAERRPLRTGGQVIGTDTTGRLSQVGLRSSRKRASGSGSCLAAHSGRGNGESIV